jgi:hypothetical protein
LIIFTGATTFFTVVVVVVGGGGFGSDFGSENALEVTPQTDPFLGMGGGEERASGCQA